MLKHVIRKINLSLSEKLYFSEQTKNWQMLIVWLRAQDDDKKILKCLVYELMTECRPAFIDRIRTRYNTVRSLRELAELEELTGKVISVISLKK